MRILIDPDKCIASGACVIAHPTVFAQDDDGIVVLLNAQPGNDQREKAQAAAAACPAFAIDVVE